MRIAICHALIVFLMGFAFVPVSVFSEPNLDELERIAIADPETDLQVSLSKGDLRFVGIYGYTLVAPGVPSSEAELQGIRGIEGTSDYVKNDLQRGLQEKASKYAGKYNQLLLEHLKKGVSEDKPITKSQDSDARK